MSREEKSGECIIEEPVLRDFMAIERTVMANERTFLSYIRTALGFFIGGVTFIEFFDTYTLQLVGWVFIPSGIIAFALGLWKYKKINDLIQGAGKVVHLEGKIL
jgi:putative membrane protein